MRKRLNELSLSELSRLLPDKDEMWETLESLHLQPDRTAAIVASATVEDGLRQALSSRLKIDPDEKKIFEKQGAPLETFASRIVMAYGLKMIGPNVRKDLDAIRKVRNAFAHSSHPVTFETSAIRDSCKELFTLKRVGSQPWHLLAEPTSTKQAFVTCSTVIWFTLLLAMDAKSPVVDFCNDFLRQ
jgi:hypothetical protein